MQCHKCGIETRKNLTGLCEPCLQPEVDLMVDAMLMGQATMRLDRDDMVCVSYDQEYVDYCQSFRPTGRQ